MKSEPAYISSMTDGAAQPDGSAVAFVIHTNDGQSHPFACATVDVEKMVSWLIGLGVMADDARRFQAGRKRGTESKTEIRATPVPVKQVALGAGKGPGEVTVAFDMGLFDLAFNLPHEAVKNLHAALGNAIGG